MKPIERPKYLRLKPNSERCELFIPDSVVDQILSQIQLDKPVERILIYPIRDGNLLTKTVDFLKKNGYTDSQAKSIVIGVDDRLKYVNLAKRKGYQVYCDDIISPTNKELNMKFDNILINPPYKQGLHIDFFNHSFDLLKDGGNMIVIHPSTPFINRKDTRDNGSTKLIKERVSEYRTRLTLIDGNRLFDAGFFVPLSITHLKKVVDKSIEVVYSHIDSNNKEVKLYEGLDNIFIHGNDIVLNIRDKVFRKMTSSLEDNLYRTGKKSNRYYALCRYSGHPPKKGELRVNPDFYQLIFKQNEIDYSQLLLKRGREKSEQKGGNQFNDVALNKTDKVENFHSYLLTKFARFALSINKISATLDCKELSSVPYMDFSRKWTDKQLYRHFGLTKEEVQFIESYIGDWYEADSKRKPL
jgi:hypothetical protein